MSDIKVLTSVNFRYYLFIEEKYTDLFILAVNKIENYTDGTNSLMKNIHYADL